MVFELTEEQALIKKMVREFAEKDIEPIGQQIDEVNDIPAEIFDTMRDMELFGIPYGEEYDGTGAGYTAYPPVIEELAKASSGVAVMLSVHYLGMSAISNFGTEEQKQRFLPACCRGESIMSFAFTEPGTGSDPKQLATIAKKDGDCYVLNGVKRFISNADLNGYIIIFAKEEETGLPTAFVVEKMCEGYSLSEPWHKIGLRGSRAYDIFLNDVRVPADHVLGEVGKGFPILQLGIAMGKVGMASVFLGVGQAALDEAVKYALGKPYRDGTISQFQGVQLKIADMASKIEACRWMCYRMGYLAENLTDAKDFARWSALNKLFVSDQVIEIVRKSVNVHGSYGVMNEFKVERLYRDAIIGDVIEGNADLQRLMTALPLLNMKGKGLGKQN